MENKNHQHHGHHHDHKSHGNDHSCCSLPKNNNEAAKEVSSEDKEKIYTCPMHPEVRQKGPGNCPICGMALEPEEISLEDEENPELKDFTKRLQVSATLSIPLVALAMSDLIPGQPVQHSMPAWLYSGIQLILATPVVAWGGLPFLKED